MVRQRTNSDCGVAALGILAADRAARTVDPSMRGAGGLYNRELVTAAKSLGITLRATKRFDPDRDSGILRVRWKSGPQLEASPYGHFVALIDQCIYCPIDPIAMPWRHYKEKYDAKLCTLLKVHA